LLVIFGTNRLSMKYFYLHVIFVSALLISGCKSKTCIENRSDFAKYYSQLNLSGNFVLYDLKKDKYIYYNQAQAQQAYPPGGTFKLFLSMLGFETGNIKSPGIDVPELKNTWKPEREAKVAYQNSPVHYYEQLAHNIGDGEIKNWLDKVHYGNGDTTGGVPKFWLGGGLKISSDDQLVFLRKMYEHKLPFSAVSIEKVKGMMSIKDTSGYSLKGKTGWAEQDNEDIGWFVGYVETKDDTYFFVNCIQSSDPGNPYFENARMDITYKILQNLKIMPS